MNVSRNKLKKEQDEKTGINLADISLYISDKNGIDTGIAVLLEGGIRGDKGGRGSVRPQMPEPVDIW
ncbi:hypothetical protein ACFL6H_03020 [Candidatus Latescibacterota bacterium]